MHGELMIRDQPSTLVFMETLGMHEAIATLCFLLLYFSCIRSAASVRELIAN